MSGHAHLQLVDTETGFTHPLDDCPQCAVHRDEIAGLQRDVRGWAARYAQLKREKDDEAKASKLWPVAIERFNLWKELCRHPRAKWTPDRFWDIHPFLTDDGPEMCDRAIRGAAFDPYVTTRKNGSRKRHDDWSLIFRSRDKFEEFANRAPREEAA